MRDVEVGAEGQSLTLRLSRIRESQDERPGTNQRHLRMYDVVAFPATHHHSEGPEWCSLQNFTEGFGGHVDSLPEYQSLVSLRERKVTQTRILGVCVTFHFSRTFYRIPYRDSNAAHPEGMACGGS